MLDLTIPAPKRRRTNGGATSVPARRPGRPKRVPEPALPRVPSRDEQLASAVKTILTDLELERDRLRQRYGVLRDLARVLAELQAD